MARTNQTKSNPVLLIGLVAGGVLGGALGAYLLLSRGQTEVITIAAKSGGPSITPTTDVNAPDEPAPTPAPTPSWGDQLGPGAHVNQPPDGGGPKPVRRWPPDISGGDNPPIDDEHQSPRTIDVGDALTP